MGTLWSAAFLLLMGLGLLATPGTARAQNAYDTDLQQNWSLRIGLYIPQMAAVRGQEGDVGFSGFVERTVYTTPEYDLTVGIGYQGFGDVYSVPIMVHGIGKYANLRYGIGAGYAFGKRLSGRGMAGAAFGLLVGYQLTYGRNPISAELRYNFIAGADQELDGYSITVGAKF